MHLTPRENELIECVCQAMTNSEISWALRISEETVRRHLSNIFDKLGVSTRTELVIMILGKRHDREIAALSQTISELESASVRS